MRIQGLALAELVALATLGAAPALAQPVDLAVASVEVRGDPGRPGGQLEVTARIRRLDRGPLNSVIAVVRFRSPSDARIIAERRITLAPGEQATVTVPWTARVGHHVVSVSVAVGTVAAVDRQRRNDIMTTRDIVIFARGARNAPPAEPPTEIGTGPLAALRAPPASIATAALSMTSAPPAVLTAGGLSAATAPPTPIAPPALSMTTAPPVVLTVGGLSAASAPPALIATGTLALASAPVTALATAPLSATSAPAASVPVRQLTSMSAPALAVESAPLGAESRPPPDPPTTPPGSPPANQPSDQPSNQSQDQPTGAQPARQP